jgi:hypothetical protein
MSKKIFHPNFCPYRNDQGEIFKQDANFTRSAQSDVTVAVTEPQNQ